MQKGVKRIYEAPDGAWGAGIGKRPVVPHYVYWPLVPLVLPRSLGFCTYVYDGDAVGVLYCPADAPGCTNSD